MSESAGPDQLPDIPLFSECVVGYRAWRVDEKDQLWPLWSKRRPWLPGVNSARCNCPVTNSLKFVWSWQDGRRVLEPAPKHAAPETACVCGLYSWRRPPGDWYRQPALSAPPSVVGAVASWGRMQVHDAGFRAEHACVVTIAYHERIASEARERLRRIAARYRVELVALASLGELEQAASVHGTPLPDTLRPPPYEPPPDQPLGPTHSETPVRSGPDEEDPTAVAKVAAWASRTPVGPLVARQRRIGLGWRLVFLVLECATAIAFALLAATTYSSQARTDFVQRHGLHAAGQVIYENPDPYAACPPRSAGSCYSTELNVRLKRPVDGLQSVTVDYARNIPVRRGQAVQVVLDPRDPAYAELVGQPRSSSGIWIVGVILAAAAVVVLLVDGRRVLQLIRHGHAHPRRRASVLTRP